MGKIENQSSKNEKNCEVVKVKEVTKTKIPLLFKLRKRFVKDVIEMNFSKINVESKFNEIMKESIENLKYCLEYEYILEEYKNKYKGNNWPGEMPKLKLLSQYNFHITMLGIIDCKIDYFDKLAQECEGSYDYKHFTTKQALLQKRTALAIEIIEAIKPNENIKNAIINYPTHGKLSTLFKNMLQEENKIDTTVADFNKSYDNGYCIGYYNCYRYFEDKYIKAKNELKEHSEKIEKKSQKTRTK